MGDGVMPALTLEKWMHLKGSTPISLTDLIAYWEASETASTGNEIISALANIFEIDSDKNKIQIEKYRGETQKSLRFYCLSVPPENLVNNMKTLLHGVDPIVNSSDPISAIRDSETTISNSASTPVANSSTFVNKDTEDSPKIITENIHREPRLVYNERQVTSFSDKELDVRYYKLTGFLQEICKIAQNNPEAAAKMMLKQGIKDNNTGRVLAELSRNLPESGKKLIKCYLDTLINFHKEGKLTYKQVISELYPLNALYSPGIGTVIIDYLNDYTFKKFIDLLGSLKEEKEKVTDELIHEFNEKRPDPSNPVDALTPELSVFNRMKKAWRNETGDTHVVSFLDMELISKERELYKIAKKIKKEMKEKNPQLKQSQPPKIYDFVELEQVIKAVEELMEEELTYTELLRQSRNEFDKKRQAIWEQELKKQAQAPNKLLSVDTFYSNGIGEHIKQKNRNKAEDEKNDEQNKLERRKKSQANKKLQAKSINIIPKFVGDLGQAVGLVEEHDFQETNSRLDTIISGHKGTEKKAPSQTQPNQKVEEAEQYVKELLDKANLNNQVLQSLDYSNEALKKINKESELLSDELEEIAAITEEARAYNEKIEAMLNLLEYVEASTSARAQVEERARAEAPVLTEEAKERQKGLIDRRRKRQARRA